MGCFTLLKQHTSRHGDAAHRHRSKDLSVNYCGSWPYVVASQLPRSVFMTEEQKPKQGVPLELRPWVWMELCGATRRQKQSMPGYFDAMLQRGEVSSECAHQIELVSFWSMLQTLHLKLLLEAAMLQTSIAFLLQPGGGQPSTRDLMQRHRWTTQRLRSQPHRTQV